MIRTKNIRVNNSDNTIMIDDTRLSLIPRTARTRTMFAMDNYIVVNRATATFKFLKCRHYGFSPDQIFHLHLLPRFVASYHSYEEPLFTVDSYDNARKRGDGERSGVFAYGTKLMLWSPSTISPEDAKCLKWVACDRDGAVYAFANEPDLYDNEFDDPNGSSARFLGKVEYNGDWKESVREVSFI